MFQHIGRCINQIIPLRSTKHGNIRIFKSLSLASNAKLAQRGWYQAGMTEVPSSILTGGNFFSDFFSYIANFV